MTITLIRLDPSYQPFSYNKVSSSCARFHPSRCSPATSRESGVDYNRRRIQALRRIATQCQSESSNGTEIHQVGDIVDEKYRMEGILGRGASGTTLKCTRVSDGKLVAMKFMSLKRAATWKQIELFEREAQTLRQLDHPNIPSYLDSFEIDTKDDRRFYLVQELVDGTSLADLIRSGKRVSETEVKRIALELLNVLLYLSKMQPPVIHRDVKPENVILDSTESNARVYLVDFGGVQAIDSGDLTGSTIIGTYGYMAPEQFRGTANAKSDLYGLGATLLYLVSGRHPTSFKQERLKIDFEDSISTSDVLVSLLNALLEPLPEDRINAEAALALLTKEIGPTLRRGRTWRSKKRNKPVGARSTITRKGSTSLEIDIPASGLSGSNLVTGSFALAWNAFVIVWSYSAIMSGGIFPLLFSIPFWVAGAQITRLSFANALLSENLKIDRRYFYLTRELAFLKRRSEEFGTDNEIKNAKKQIQGKTADLSRPQIVTSVVVNGRPQKCIEFKEGVRTHAIGEGLTQIEQEWLVDEINDVLITISENAGIY